MSKWKSLGVNIVQIIHSETGSIYGLGDDDNIYKWDYPRGAWKKYWEVKDEP